MFETTDEIEALQRLLDASFARASEHLVSIMTPGRRVSAARLVTEFPAPAILSIASVTRHGEPRISAVDAHFRHGRWYFTTLAGSPKARQLTARNAISASFLPRPTFGMFCHGRAFLLSDGPERATLIEHLVATYGQSPDEWGEEIAYFRIHAEWLVAFDASDTIASSSSESGEGLTAEGESTT